MHMISWLINRNTIKQQYHPVPTIAESLLVIHREEDTSNARDVQEYKTPTDIQRYIHVGSNAKSFLPGLHPH